MGTNDKLIEIKNVTKRFKLFTDKAYTLKEKVIHRKRRRYQEREVLHNINLSVYRGESVGLIGENGSGKSTLLKMMTGILYPEAGTIDIKGRVSSLLELGAGFHPDLSGRENVYINSAIFGLSRKETDERFQDILDFSELHEYISNPVRTYSSGMYARLAFSVAINVDAEVLLIDEILAVGDENFKDKCYKKLDQLKKSGVTIVLVSHELKTVEKFCNRAVWLNNGRIAKDGDRFLVTDAYKAYMKDKQANSFDNGKDFDQDDVHYAYHYILQRAPGSDQVVNDCCNAFHDLNEMVEAILDSEEYSIKAESLGFSGKDKEDVKREFESYRYHERHKQEEEATREKGEPPDISDEGEKRLRFGNGKVTITGLTFTDSNDPDMETLTSGRDVSACIHYKVNEEVPRYVFGIDFYTLDNVHCFSAGMRQDGCIVDNLQKTGTVYCKLKNMNLAAGEYKVSVYVEDHTYAPLDYIRNYRTFYVTSESDTSGLVQLAHDWTAE